MSEPVQRVHLVNVATGICFVAIGVLLLMQRMGAIEMRQIVELWPLALIVVGSAVVWEAMRGGDLKGSGACAGWLFWVVVLGLVFSHAFDRRDAAAASTAPGTVNTFALMGGGRPVHDGPFSGGSVTNVMAGTSLNLTRAILAPGEAATVDVFNVLGGTEIYVPADWQVEIQTTTVAGGINDQRRRPDRTADEDGNSGSEGDAVAEPTPPAPRLILQGVVLLGGVTVK